MSTAIGVALGEFGLLATDTRLSEGPDGPHNDAEPWVVQTRDGPHELVTSRDRKLRCVPGGWAVCGGPELLTGCVSLAQLSRDGVDDLDAVQHVVRAAPSTALRVLHSWGVNVTEAVEQACHGGNGIALLRPTPGGVEYHLIEAESRRGGPGIVDVWPPRPLTVRQTRRVQRWRIESLARRPDVTNGELLLGVARTIVDLSDAGAWSISCQVHCGMILQAPDASAVRLARLDFECVRLLERITAPELDAALLEIFRAAPVDGSAAAYVDLAA